MIGNLIRNVIGSKNSRELKRMSKIVEKINSFETEIQALSDTELQAKTAEFKERIEKGSSLEKILPEAFAVCREASVRVMGLRHFDVQMIGGITLHEGAIAEMRTGEGKTLVATLPTYLNTLTGKSVHVVTVNEYLARRDAEWMQPLYEFLGLSVGVVVPGQNTEEKRQQYAADIVYGTNNEFGFDYLRDNMAFSLEDKVQRDLTFAIVDEVDSILIDEARTPLIISGPAEDSSETYRAIDKLVPKLERGELNEESPELNTGHYVIDEKSKSVELTETGHEVVEDLLIEIGLLKEGDSLYAPSNLALMHHVLSALKAHAVFQKNVDYIVQGGQIVIVDEHTGRTMPGRRWSEGLHQAVEAKEGLEVQPESQTLASTTFQNYFRLYDKLAGMTGTADTEAAEFDQIYGLKVNIIPTNRPIARKDLNDVIYMTVAEKFEAIAKDVVEIRESGAPVLVGTASIESSEALSALLKKKKIQHQVLNAKFHEKEAEIIADAGRPGAVTIATNMAGRGTDIVLGGSLEAELAKLDNPSDTLKAQLKADWQKRHQQVLDAGGLHILGSERHESRRIDNQLRGRAGRQGDPGSTRFYLSLEDSLMRIFASDRVKNFMKALGMKEGEAIEHRMVSNAIEKAQRKVEGRNFDMRKQLLEYDDVANEQRKVIYHMRNGLLASEDVGDVVAEFRHEVLSSTIVEFIPPQSLPEQWDIAGLETAIAEGFGTELPIQAWLDADDALFEDTLIERIREQVIAAYQEKEDLVGAEGLRNFEKQIILRVLDDLWKEHLSAMDHLRHGIHLRGYAQKNPKQEYKRESFNLFRDLLESIKRDSIRILSNVKIRQEDPEEEEARLRRQAEEMAARMQFQHEHAAGFEGEQETAEAQPQPAVAMPVRNEPKIGRNEPCTCGSGKKYKHCCGRIS